MNTNLNDKDKAMDTAIRFQKRMRIPKFFFLILGITVVLAFIQDVITGSNFLQITIVQIIFVIYFSFGQIPAMIMYHNFILHNHRRNLPLLPRIPKDELWHLRRHRVG